MLTYLLYALIGLLAGLLAGVAKGSVRRLTIGGAAGTLVAFVAFPFSRSVGYLSRETVDPTLLAAVPIFPLLLLVPILSVAALVLVRRGGTIAGWAGLVGGVGSLLIVLAWLAQPGRLVKLAPVTGLMELLTALLLAGLVVLVGLGRPNLRTPMLVAGGVVGVLTFIWMMGPGHTYLPKSAGYYKLLAQAPAGIEGQILEQYNTTLEERNQVARENGLPESPRIESLSALTGTIPQEAADQGLRLLRPAALQYGALAVFLLAGLMVGAGLSQLRNPRLEEAGDFRAGLIFTSVLSLLLPAFDATEFALSKIVKGWPFLAGFLDRSWPPNLVQLDPTDPERSIFPLQSVFSEMALTIEIALVGTFLAAIFAVPSSFLAARNLTQGNSLMRGLFTFMRGFYNVDRGVDTLILALVFVAAVGLGPFAGVLAMAIHSIADLGKLYSEAIENVDKGQIEALESVGASGVNVLRWGILPQVLPLFVSYTLYRFEINFRVSVVLGLVGAGGIGFFIKGAMDAGHYDQMIIGVIAIVLVVNAMDFASSWLRSKLV
jgi:phosphonate ABC transporter permease subunit PhnE